jgi:NADH:ubiquinone oxidoreductase subunit 4 (subunit M)
MHNRPGPKVASHEIGIAEAAAIVPLVLVVLVLAFYPQFVLRRSEPSVKTALAPAVVASTYWWSSPPRPVPASTIATRTP